MRGTFCSSFNYAAAHYFDPEHSNRTQGASDGIAAEWSFHEPADGSLFCNILELADDIFLALEVEFKVAGVGRQEAIERCCDGDGACAGL